MTNQKNTRIASAGAASSSNSTVTPIIAGQKTSSITALQRFIAQVLPDDSIKGEYYVAGKHNGKFNRVAVHDASGLADTVAKYGASQDIWISMGKFDGGSTAANCVLKKGFYIDLDYGDGKGLRTHNEATSALESAVKAGLPKPSLVLGTGNGFHVHWILDKPISPDEWKPIAKKLQDFIDPDKGLAPLATDKCVTIDVARILRAPDTFNFKAKPKPVHQFYPDDEIELFYSADSFENAVTMPVVRKTAPTATCTKSASRNGDHKWDELTDQEKDSALAEMLGILPTDEAIDRDKWSKIVASCARSGAPNAMDICRSWSKTAQDKYDDDGFNQTYASFQSDGTITIGSLIKKAYNAGWNSPWSTKKRLFVTGLVVDTFDQITEKNIEWLWPDHIPTGKLTIFGGNAGLNKSTLCLSIAASVTNGTPWPDGTACKKGEVIIMNSEDDPSDTIKPRLRLAGADLSMVHFMSFAEVCDPKTQTISKVAFSFVNHLSDLERLFKNNSQISLIVVDPLTAFCSGITNAHDAAEIRSALSPLIDVLATHGVAMLALMHLNKSEGASVQNRFNGSGAWVQVARSVWLVDRDPEFEMRRLLLPVKNNLAPDTSGNVFDIEIKDDHPVLTWLSDSIELTADQHMGNSGAAGKNLTKADEAAAWLKDLLESGPKLKIDIDTQAKEYGYSESTLRRAKKAINVDTRKITIDSDDTAWEWYLPEDPNEKLEVDGQGGQTIPAPPLSQAGDHLDQHAQNDSQGVQTVNS